MDLQTLIVAITVGIAAAFVLRTFTRQFTSRGRQGCGSCSHGGAMQTGQTMQSGQSGQSGAHENGGLIQVESIQVEDPARVEKSARE